LGISVPKVLGKDEKVATFFDRSLGHIQKPSLVRFVATTEPLGDVGRNRDRRTTHLERETVCLLLGKHRGESVHLQHVLGFFNTYRHGTRVIRKTLTEIADQFQGWLKNRSQKWGAPLLEPPEGEGDESRRDKFLDPYFQNAQPNQVAAILKAREPARILVAIGDKDNNSPHLEYQQRWVNQFNFYRNDTHWGRMFVRICPYFPFSARVCLNQHHWLAIRMQAEGIDFQQSTNAFLKCANPARWQELADSLGTQDLLRCGQKWLAAFTPFLSDRERKQAGCQHRLFFSQVEYCDNLIFHPRAAIDELTQRLLDLNRAIGQPKKITMIFGRKVTKQYKGKLQTVIEDLDLPNPVIRSHYGHGFAKQYVAMTES